MKIKAQEVLKLMTHRLYSVCSLLCLTFNDEKIAKIFMYSFVSLLTPVPCICSR
jgi:hypothetical protein